MTRQEISRLVYEALAEASSGRVRPEAVRDQDSLTGAPLGIDSLTFIRVVLGMEERVNCEFGDQLMMRAGFKKVGELIDFIDGAVQRSAVSP